MLREVVRAILVLDVALGEDCSLNVCVGGREELCVVDSVSMDIVGIVDGVGVVVVVVDVVVVVVVVVADGLVSYGIVMLPAALVLLLLLFITLLSPSLLPLLTQLPML